MVDQQTAFLKLLQLSSPTLPVGAFAYSQGLESAVDAGFVVDTNTLETWLLDSLKLSLMMLDIPVLSRLYQGWESKDLEAVRHWNGLLYAQRETSELRAEDQQQAVALARLLADLDIGQADDWKTDKTACFLTLFSLAAVAWNIEKEQAAYGYLWSWLDKQIAAAIKLVPLGQTDGQRVLSSLLPRLPALLEQGLACNDEQIGASLPMLAILSSQHETQYSRLFRS
ncbi:urease accessory protein UreF [Thiolapillus sp.]